MNKNSLIYIALQKFKKSFWGVFSIVLISLIGIVSACAYIFAPDNSKNANQMHLSIHSKSPGFKVNMLVIPSEEKEVKNKFITLFSGRDILNEEIPVFSYTIKDNIITYKPYISDGVSGLPKKIDLSHFKEQDKPFIEERVFIFGTDKYGRDYLSRLLIGSRISFSIGFVAVIISLIVGLLFGCLAGYYGGKLDALIMWLVNVTWSIPTLLLVIAVTLALGKGFWQVFIAVGLTMWVEVARVARGQVLSVKEMQYVTAAKALGFSDKRIIFKHILPNILSALIVISAANFAAAILIESGLSFLGVGAQPPTPSWGAMIKNHYNYIIMGQPYLAILPGFCILILVMCFMLLGNTLRDALDVKA